jgi:hypothetical protein
MALFTTVPELAKEMHKDASKLYEMARREEDPLPLRYFEGDRYGFVLVPEVEEWVKRNSELANERRGDGQ